MDPPLQKVLQHAQTKTLPGEKRNREWPLSFLRSYLSFFRENANLRSQHLQKVSTFHFLL